MAFNMDVSGLIAAFGVDLTIYPVDSGQGDYVNGHWVPKRVAPFSVKEPFVPNNRVGRYSINPITRETGINLEYEAVWISKEEVVPVNSVVERNDRRYVVLDVKNLKDYSNAVIYYLSSEENQQSELAKEGDV